MCVIKLNGILAVSNGVNLSGAEGISGSNTLCQYKLLRSKYLPIFVVITDFICDDTPSEIIAAIDSGKFDFQPLRTFKGRDVVPELRKSLVDKIKQEEAMKRFEEKVALIGLTAEELQQLKTVDWYHDYTDDGSVWRAAEARHKKVKASVGEWKYSEYRNAVLDR
jgi:hypothetical protein